MTKFFGEIGYAENIETPPDSGIWKDVITEYPYYGDLVMNARGIQEAEAVNDDITVDVTISIVADERLRKNFIAIKYVRYAGALWKLAKVTDQGPRLLLRLGGVYNGPKASVTSNP